MSGAGSTQKAAPGRQTAKAIVANRMLPFKLEGECGLLNALKQRLHQRSHAVVVVAEGAGQDLLAASDGARDASGNVKLRDIGAFLRERIEAYCIAENIPAVMRYFDPNYIIRSCRASAEDSILCDLYARNAAHAARCRERDSH